jgi:hypothetical protein
MGYNETFPERKAEAMIWHESGGLRIVSRCVVYEVAAEFGKKACGMMRRPL